MKIIEQVDCPRCTHPLDFVIEGGEVTVIGGCVFCDFQPKEDVMDVMGREFKPLFPGEKEEWEGSDHICPHDGIDLNDEGFCWVCGNTYEEGEAVAV
jgi:hypothetical protein